MKKLLAILLALIMVMGLATTTFAATTDLVITDGSTYASNRSYKAYQVLNASVDGLNFAYQLNPKYTDALLEALNLTKAADETETQLENKIVGAIKAIGNDVEKMRHFADDLYNIILAKGLAADTEWVGNTVTVDQGYWVIADVTNLEGTDYSNSLVMVDTVGDVKVEITNKPDVPTTNKKVDDENDSLTGNPAVDEDATNLQDTADYDIGDEVPYVIEAELPNNITEYKYYSLIMKDTASEGLTFLPNTFAITVNQQTRTIKEKGAADAEGADFWYEIDEVTNTLYVYPAHPYETYELDESTTDVLDDYVTKNPSSENGGDFLKLFPADTAHSTVNNSRIVFSYKCLLNEDAVSGAAGNPNEYELIYSNNPYDDGFGKTKTDINLVLTYKGIFNKVDTDGNPLEGADFALYKFIAKLGKDYFTDTEAANAWAAENDAGKTYILHEGANAWGYYEEITRKEASGEIDNPETPEDESTTDTTFTFSGLDDGYYKLVETQVPAGFNGIDPIEFRIIANHVAEINSTSEVNLQLSANSQIAGELTIVGDVATGSVEADVQNRSGTELPHTGGIGTTLFYVFGGILVCGAVVLLITKKRMAA